MVEKSLIPLRQAADKAALASQQRDETIRRFHADGVTMRTIATAVGLSPGRIHQIIHGR